MGKICIVFSELSVYTSGGCCDVIAPLSALRSSQNLRLSSRSVDSNSVSPQVRKNIPSLTSATQNIGVRQKPEGMGATGMNIGQPFILFLTGKRDCYYKAN